MAKTLTNNEMDALECCLEDDEAEALFNMRQLFTNGLISKDELNEYVQYLVKEVKRRGRE